jgi:glyoxylase-like metal-dependent hydrolase (beta-lactamase superfamily II)
MRVWPSSQQKSGARVESAARCVTDASFSGAKIARFRPFIGAPRGRTVRVGDIEITPLRDGWLFPPPGYLGEHAHPERDPGSRDESGVARFPVGCFLLRTSEQTLLVDAGIGQIPEATARDLAAEGYLFRGGELPSALREAQVAPEQIDAVLCTHLHLDHCGGLISAEGQAAFENAGLWVGRADWDRYVLGREGSMTESLRAVLQERFRRGHVELLTGDRVIAPGVTALATPGHTPGHYSVVVSAGNERAFILGDAVTCPAQLEEAEWHALSDVDAATAARTREALFRELEKGGGAATGCHFPGLEFGRVIRGSTGRTWSRIPLLRA